MYYIMGIIQPIETKYAYHIMGSYEPIETSMYHIMACI